MGIVAAVFIHAILFTVLFAVCTGLAILARRMLGIKSGHWLWALRLAPFFIAALPFAVFALNIVWANIAPPPVLFERVFDRAADAEVTDLIGASDATNDAQHIFLGFRTSGKTLSRLTNGLRSLAPDYARDKVPLPVAPMSVPSWWTAQHCPDRTVFGAENVRQWDEIVVVECRSDKRVYVEAIWIE